MQNHRGCAAGSLGRRAGGDVPADLSRVWSHTGGAEAHFAGLQRAGSTSRWIAVSSERKGDNVGAGRGCPRGDAEAQGSVRGGMYGAAYAETGRIQGRQDWMGQRGGGAGASGTGGPQALRGEG